VLIKDQRSRNCPRGPH